MLGLVVFLVTLSLLKCQPINPIVPTNSGYYPITPSFPSFSQTQYSQYQPPYSPYQLQYGQPVNSFRQPNSPIQSSNFASTQRQFEQPPLMHPRNRASMAPIQVVYGKPVPLERSADSIPPSVSSLPQFLQGAPDSVIDQYKRIIRKPNSNYDEQVKEISKLVSNLDEEKQSLYQQFMSENDEREQQHRERVHQNIHEMSQRAQEQFATISAILRNPTMPNEERWAKVVDIYGKFDSELRDEFENKFKDFQHSS